VRHLLDANLCPRLAVHSPRPGTTSPTDLDLLAAPDSVIFDRAVDDRSVVVTADTDFSMLLRLRRASVESLRGDHRKPQVRGQF
jgi:predicted nuclease of predicted toxin-antitoxin system